MARKKKKRNYKKQVAAARKNGELPKKAGGKPGPKPGGKKATNDNAKRKRDAYNHEKENGKPPAGKEVGHGKGGVKKTSKTRAQSVKSNRAAGGRKSKGPNARTKKK